MAWTAVAAAGSTGNATANSTIITATLNAQVGVGANVGDVLILALAVDNASSVAGDEGAVLSVADSAGNTWAKAAEFTNGGAAARAGATCSIWYTPVRATLTTANTVSATMGSSASRDAQAMRIWRYTPAPGAVLRVVGTNTTLANAALNPGSLDFTAPAGGQEYLRFRGIAAETTITTALSTTAGWTTIGTNRASATGAMAIFGEYIISSATTVASNPVLGAAVDSASVLAVFEEVSLMGQQIL